MLDNPIVDASLACPVFATDGVHEAAPWQGAFLNKIEPAFDQCQQLCQCALLIHRRRKELDNDVYSISKLADEREIIPTVVRPNKFAPRHFYHLAEPANWPSIRRHGLLSTERLLDLAKAPENEREAILSQHRPESIVLSNGVIIRDQKPMPPHLIARALPRNVTPCQWYRFLNRFVFLWSNRARVERHLRACRARPQILLTFDASQLLEQLGDKIFLSPINSGNARRRPVPRSPHIFVPYIEWIKSGWRPIDDESRRRSCPPAEILVEGNLAIEPFLVSAGTVRYGSLANFEAEAVLPDPGGTELPEF
jgi:hypothetical protein